MLTNEFVPSPTMIDAIVDSFDEAQASIINDVVNATQKAWLEHEDYSTWTDEVNAALEELESQLRQRASSNTDSGVMLSFDEVISIIEDVEERLALGEFDIYSPM